MNSRFKLLALACLVLQGCAGTTAGILVSSKAKEVTIDDQVITVAPIEGNHWGATKKALQWGPTLATVEKPRYVRAVEAVTGCKVVEAEYNSQFDHLHALVACAK